MALFILASEAAAPAVEKPRIQLKEFGAREVFSQHLIEPEKRYWPDTLKPAGRWPQTQHV